MELLLLLLGQLALSSVPSGWGRWQQLLSNDMVEGLPKGLSSMTDGGHSETGVGRLPSVSAVDEDEDDDDDNDDDEDDEEDDDDR